MNKSYLIAGSLFLAAVLWLASGHFLRAENTDSSANTQQNLPGDDAGTEVIVEAEIRQAEAITSYINVQGDLQPDRSVTLRAETGGRVEEILQREGSRVETGDPVIQLAIDDRAIRREQAELRIEETRRRYEATRDLEARGFASQTELDTALVEMKRAEVELEQIELEIGKTTIRAPFDGVLDATLVEIGDFISTGNEVATVVDNDPLIVTVHVPQQSVHFVELDEEVEVTLGGGRTLNGQVRYISARANEESRTFRVEIAIPNDGDLRAGSSASAAIPRENIRSHFISGALLSLNEAGVMGVKTVDQTGLVSFHPVTIEHSEPGGMWVSGLPERARVITSGQGFAKPGERVRVASDDSNEVSRVQPH